MLNERSVATVSASKFGPGWIKPAYGGASGAYCFAGIADTIRQLHGLPARSPLPADVLPALAAAG